jgi:hypothetical protein
MLEFGWQWYNQHGVKLYQESNKVAMRPEPRTEL